MSSSCLYIHVSANCALGWLVVTRFPGIPAQTAAATQVQSDGVCRGGCGCQVRADHTPRVQSSSNRPISAHSFALTLIQLKTRIWPNPRSIGAACVCPNVQFADYHVNGQ